MAGFKEILGNEHLKDYLKNSIKIGKVYHAYIFSGEDNSGKKMMADAFSMMLQCEEKNENDACMECHFCRQSMSKNNPDIIWVGHEKASIGVDVIREKINNDIAIKPYSCKYKIYILDEAEKMTVQAQNSLLKTIEEPPEYAIIILITNNAQSFLPTILSRCITLTMKPVENKRIREYLVTNCEVPAYMADLCTAFAQGNVGKAIKLAKSEHFNEIKEEAVSLVKNIENMELFEVINAVNDVQKYKLEINDFLDIMMVWYRDVLLFKAVNDGNGLVFRDDIGTIITQARKSSYNGIEQILEGIEKAKTRLNANVNFDLVMELLFLTIKEN